MEDFNPLLLTTAMLESFTRFQLSRAVVWMGDGGMGVNPECCFHYIESGREPFFPPSIHLPLEAGESTESLVVTSVVH